MPAELHSVSGTLVGTFQGGLKDLLGTLSVTNEADNKFRGLHAELRKLAACVQQVYQQAYAWIRSQLTSVL